MSKTYTPFGKEWESEIEKLPKAELIKMIRKIQTGTEERALVCLETAEDASRMAEGIINDFEGGISDKRETMRLLGEYTARIMHVFYDNAKRKFKENPSLLND